MTDNIPDSHIDYIFFHGARPLWEYLQETLGIDIIEVCQRVARDEPVLTTDQGELVVRMVDLPHRNQLTHMSNNDVIFLLNSVNVVFESLKAGVEKDGEKVLESYKFKLDSDKNMYLVDSVTDVPIWSKGLAVVPK